MDKKTIYYIIGGVAILGIGYYLMNKGKKPNTQNNETDDNSMALDSMTLDKRAVKNKSELTKIPLKLRTLAIPTSTPAPTPKKLTPQELEVLLQKKCGKKPKLKRNKIKYEECRFNLTEKLKGDGVVAFDGSYVIAENVEDEGFFSNFDNGLDLDL